MREIVLDTETTGLNPADNHRVIEIACVELLNHVPTGGSYHTYLDPERDVPEAAYHVHGLSREFLSAQPRFAAVADVFLDFIGDSRLVIHNAEFDLRFLNAELEKAQRPPLDGGRAVDTVALARRKFPGASASLDALCRRFAIDLTVREKHGALIDCELLARVYLELLGGRQPGLAFGGTARAQVAVPARPVRPPRPHAASVAERAAHAAFLAKIKDPIWNK